MGKQLAEYLERDYRENWDRLRWLAGYPKWWGDRMARGNAAREILVDARKRRSR